MMASIHEVPAHRACVHCRSQKVRCIPDDNKPDVCQRCARSGRPCAFLPIAKRKQRKRTDTRVAELEREMRAMRSALKRKEEALGARSSSPLPEEPTSQPTGLWYQSQEPEAPRFDQETTSNNTHEHPKETDGSFTSASPDAPALWPRRTLNRPAQDVMDVVDSGKISMATARRLLDVYRNDLFHHYPMVAVADSVTADELRRTKPMLFLAMIAAASGRERPDLSVALDEEVLKAYATRSLMQSEKSLELVQALLISSIWYHPPKKFGQLKYYEYMHMAATMAMDIGIGSRPTIHRSQFQKLQSLRANIHPAEDVNNPSLSMTPRSHDSVLDTTSLESRRTFLACYFVTVGVSLSLRRPNMLRCSSYIRECVEVLETSPQALPTDRTLIAVVRLMMIGEDISTSFCYDDPGDIVSIADLRTQLMLKDFERRLSNWYQSIPDPDMGAGGLIMMYYSVQIYLHEIALHVDHSPEDFRAPFQMGSVHPFPEADQIPTQVLAETLAESIKNAHALLDVFLAMTPVSLRGVPVFTFVRVSFAAFVLAKLCLSASTAGSRIGQILDKTSLKVERYMDRLILHVREVIGPHQCRVPAIFLALLFKLRQWCLHPEMIGTPQAEESSNAIRYPSDDIETLRMLTIADSRVVEQLSSTDSSPQASSRTTQPTVYDVSDEIGTVPTYNGAVASHESVHPPDNNRSKGLYAGTAPNTAMLDASLLNTSFASSNPLPLQSGPYNPNMTQMEMDNTYFNMLNNMNAFAEGGLTGLDDWAAEPMDIMGSLDMLGWDPNMNTTTQ